MTYYTIANTHTFRLCVICPACPWYKPCAKSKVLKMIL